MPLDEVRQLGEAIEARDQDNGVLDEMFGDTGFGQENLEDMVNNVAEALGLDESEEDVRQILQTYLDKVDLMDEIADDEIEKLFKELEGDLAVYGDFVRDMIRIDDASEDSREIMSTCEGRIKRIDLQFFNVERAVSAVSSFDAAFDLDVEIVILVTGEGRYKFDMESFVKQLGIEKSKLPSGRKIKIVKTPKGELIKTPYVRDTHVKLSDGTLVPQSRDRMNYSPRNIEQLGRKLGVEVEIENELIYQGGNMRATENVLYVGVRNLVGTLFGNMAGGLFIKDEDLVRMRQLFEERFGKKVVVVGLFSGEDGYQIPPQENTFHIDLFLTPISDQEIIVAAPIFDDNDESLDSETRSARSQVYYDIGEMVDVVRTQAPQVHVITMPTPFMDKVLITYNNCLVEKFHDENGELVTRFYIPKYHTRDLQTELDSIQDIIDLTPGDEKNRKWWEKEKIYMRSVAERSDEIDQYNQQALGFFQSLELAEGRVEVRQVEVDIMLLMHQGNGLGGSLNCLTNEFRARE